MKHELHIEKIYDTSDRCPPVEGMRVYLDGKLIVNNEPSSLGYVDYTVEESFYNLLVKLGYHLTSSQRLLLNGKEITDNEGGFN